MPETKENSGRERWGRVCQQSTYERYFQQTFT